MESGPPDNGPCRVGDHLDVGDVLINRRGRDKILLAERRLDQSGIEVALGAVALDAAWRPGKASASVVLDDLVDAQRRVVVAACRGMSGHVIHPHAS